MVTVPSVPKPTMMSLVIALGGVLSAPTLLFTKILILFEDIPEIAISGIKSPSISPTTSPVTSPPLLSV